MLFSSKCFVALIMTFGVSVAPAVAQFGKKDGAKPSKTVTAKKEVSGEARTDIVQTAKESGNFRTLTAALDAADLAETLKGKGPYTVFAPTDKAFAKLPKGAVESLLRSENKKKLVAILTYHVLPTSAASTDIMELKSAKTINGKAVMVKVEGDIVHVNDATVTKADIPCANGVIHVIDTVLMPKE